MGELWLIRHGATRWSESGQHTGRTDLPLTEKGIQQARATGALIAQQRFATALTSPAQRTRHTAELIGLAWAQVEPLLWEWDYGGYEGISTHDIRKERPGWDVWRDGVIPGETPGETVDAVGARADAVIEKVQDTLHADQNVAVISHGHMSRIFIARWLGLPADAGSLFTFETGHIAICGFERERHVLRALNVAG
ncbi:MAG: histidine phosphatase family protein [Corynebacteriales bacterium]|nr:histidine phosphatase family protein [Mycobacteriales bacterium]